MTFQEMPELLTLHEVTDLLRVHANTLRNWEKQGVIQVVRIGRRGDRRYRKEVIKEFMERGI